MVGLVIRVADELAVAGMNQCDLLIFLEIGASGQLYPDLALGDIGASCIGQCQHLLIGLNGSGQIEIDALEVEDVLEREALGAHLQRVAAGLDVGGGSIGFPSV